jgi:poly(A) polymerase
MLDIELDLMLAPSDPITRFAAATPDLDAARAVAARLKLSGEEAGRLKRAVGREPRVVSYMSLKEMRRALYALGRETFLDRARIAWAEDDHPRSATPWRGLLALAETWTPPVLPLTGAQIMAAGVPQGPKIGAVMREVEAWWIDADFPDDELSLVERLKAVAQALG